MPGITVVSTTDPGAIGAGRIWLKPPNNDVFVRNAINTAWTTLCPPPCGGPAPLYEGTFTFREDGGGSADGVSANTISSDNTVPWVPAADTNYRVVAQIIPPQSGDYSPAAWINAGGGGLINALWSWGTNDPPIWNINETFNSGHVNPNIGNPTFFAASSAGQHGSQLVQTCHFAIYLA